MARAMKGAEHDVVIGRQDGKPQQRRKPKSDAFSPASVSASSMRWRLRATSAIGRTCRHRRDDGLQSRARPGVRRAMGARRWRRDTTRWRLWCSSMAVRARRWSRRPDRAAAELPRRSISIGALAVLRQYRGPRNGQPFRPRRAADNGDRAKKPMPRCARRWRRRASGWTPSPNDGGARAISPKTRADRRARGTAAGRAGGVRAISDRPSGASCASGGGTGRITGNCRPRRRGSG